MFLKQTPVLWNAAKCVRVSSWWRILALSVVCCGVASCASSSGGGQNIFTANRSSELPEYGDYLSARYAGLVRDGRAATVYYSQALKHSPEDHSLLERAIIYALVAGDTELAIKLAKKSDIEPKGGMVEIIRAVDKFSRGKYKATVGFSDDLSAGVMHNVVARSIRDWSQLGLREKGKLLPVAHSGAESRLFRSIRLYSDALLQLANDQDEHALENFEKAWNLGGRYPVGVDAYARKLAEDGQRDRALEIVDKFYEDIGDNPLLDQLDRELRAGKDIVAPRLSPKEGAAASTLGFALAIAAKQGGDIANLYYSIVLLFDPKQDAARLLLADSMRDANRLDAALEQLQKIESNSVYYGAARAREAWVLFDKGDDKAAVALANAALKTQPGRSLKMQVGDLYRSLEMYAEAESLFDQVLQSDIGEGYIDWRVLFARAGMRDKLSRWEDAESDLLAALNYAPNRPEVLNYLGYSWVDRGKNIEQAFEMIQNASAQQPDQGYIKDSLGWAYYRLNHYEKAVRHLEEAVELAPADPVINDHLGDAYWQTGQFKQAGYQWSRVVTYSNDDTLKKSAAEKLKYGLNAQLTELQIPNQ